ncbi:ABC transporter family substrate-binding protein [Mycolicibacterium sp. CBMA 226]|uniref:ABC transporter family substrate-binding protein n=1 Tax=Mycolicibacterium sp. CBMA 226 TaxID=2606611 RepID=UPI0012DDF3C9|nr:ABC transporter family substrate-binding protein [Mycolicibacterium sp. CBMA 226]MUL75672.1 ABC transporter family substrate-binding protein [Mycolicibacterium sp. CBMA 226]
MMDSDRRPLRVVLVAVLATIALVVTISGCSSQYRGSSAGAPKLGAANDLNPRDPATLKDGGNLRLALTAFPDNFNTLQIDGNTVDNAAILRPTLPRAFIVGPDGSTTVNHDYFTDIQLTSTNPQVVTYTINPKAVWTDGTPITWEDIAAQVKATTGKDPRFQIASPNGSERVASVTRGVDDRQAVMTFARPYAEWRGMFAGNGMLLPKVSTTDPEVFNKGQLTTPGPSAGPFVISNVDRGAQRITLTRNPKWWGARPLLDSITFLILDDAARIPALQNNAIDASGLGSLDDMVRVRRTKGVDIRTAPSASWSHLTFNGASGSILADPALRHAVAIGIDRRTIVTVLEHGLVENPVPLNNHIYVAGQAGYQDNSGAVPFDPAAARRELDALGWKLPAGRSVRERDGRPLTVRIVFYDAPSGRQIGQIVQQALADIGVKLELVVSSGADFFSQYIIPSNFDIAAFGWQGDAFPLSGLTQIYASDGESNFGKIGSPEIDAKIEQTLDELEPAKAQALANQLDKLLWAETFSLPLAQSPGNVAVRSTLANFGPAGLGDLNYMTIGFTKS